MSERDELPAYSAATHTEYTNWSALLEAESNGFMVCAIITQQPRKAGGRVKTWPWMVGPFEDEAAAKREQRRIRAKFKREQWKYPRQSYVISVRPAWKPVR